MARQIRPGQLQEDVLYNISASYAISASHEIVKEVSSSYADFAESASFAATASYLSSYIPPFPFVGDAVITGSLTVSGSNSVVNLQEVQFNTDHSASGHTTGRIYWDDNNKTFTGDMQGSNVRLQFGQEEHVYVFNNSGVTINNGDAVRISGANGANVTITKAVSSIKSFKDETEQDQILGVATEQIADNKRGYVTTFGAVRDLDTSAFSEGDILYLSATTSGSYSNIRPAAPNFEARVGVVQIANATEGVVLVRPQEPTFLTDISQVTSSGVVTDEKTYLVYDDSTNLISFTNEFSGSFSGSFEGNGSGLTNIPASGIVGLNLSQIASGSVTASISPDRGLHVNTDVDISGSLTVSASSHRIEGSTVIYSTSTPGLTIQSNADTAEEVKIYDGRIDIEDSGYMAARLSSNAYGSRAGVLDLRHWAGNVGAVITAQPGYTSYIQSSLLIGKTGTVNSSYAYKLDVNGDIKLGNGTDDSIEILGPVTASSDISSSASSTASFGTYLGDGSQLTGISTTPFPFSGSAFITGSLTVSQSVVDFTSASAVLLNIDDIPLVNPVVEYVDTTAITSSGTTITLPNSLSYVSSSTYEYLEVYINGLRLRYNRDFIPISNTSVRFDLSIPSGSEVTYKSLKRP